MSEQDVNADGPISEPSAEWEYRNFLCRLYRLGNIKVLGYVRIGDEWKQVVETEDMTTDVVNRVESEVDQIIQKTLREESDKIDWPFDDPVDPNPGIDPNPNPIDPEPNPNPWDKGPYYGDPDYDYPYNPTIRLSGTASVKTTNGTRTLVSLSDLDVDDFTDDGLYDG